MELTFVTAILAVLVAVSMPRLVHTAARLRTEGLAAELAHLLRAGHQMAVATGQVVVWQWDEAQRQVRLETEASDGQRTPLGGRAARSRTLPAGIAVEVSAEASPTECQCARLFPDGTSDAATVTVASSDDAYTITLNAATSRPSLAAGRPAH